MNRFYLFAGAADYAQPTSQTYRGVFPDIVHAVAAVQFDVGITDWAEIHQAQPDGALKLLCSGFIDRDTLEIQPWRIA